MMASKEKIRNALERLITIPLATLMFILLAPYLVIRRFLEEETFKDIDYER